MDDFESRLTEGLSRQARDLPRFEADLSTVRRRGRNRRWASRGAGAIGALALLGGGVALYDATQDDPSETVATNDGGDAQTVVQPTPTPTPTPDPTPVPVEAAAPTPEAAELPPTGSPEDSPLLVATGWGVGLLNQTGSLFAPLSCCQVEGPPWYDQEVQAGASTQGAVAVRDDLRGGLVTASTNTLSWTPADALTSGASTVVATAAADDAALALLQLWDVQEIDGEVRVLYSTFETNDDGSAGVSTLRALTLGEGSVEAPPETLESVAWVAEDGDRVVWGGGAWLPNGAAMSLRSLERGGCSWVEFTNPGGPVGPAVSPYPKPAPTACDRPSLDAATIDDTGRFIALSEGSAQASPQLAVYELESGERVFDTDLPQGNEEQAWWAEIDMVGSKVLLSRADMARAEYRVLDESVIVDLEGTGRPQSIPYFGFPTFPRAPVTTEGLEALELDSPLRFLLPQVDTEPEPETTPETTPEPETTPKPAPEPTPEPDPRAPAQVRMAVGRLVNIVAADALVGADGCAGPAAATVCLGAALEDARGALENQFGTERTDDPATFLEGEPHPDDTHVWLTDTRRVTLVEVEGAIGELSLFPAAPDGLASPFDRRLTIGDVLDTLGSPAEIFQGGGEGIDVVALSYDTEAAFVTYSFVQFWGEQSRLIDQDGPLTKIPVSYLDLPIVAYRAEPAG